MEVPWRNVPAWRRREKRHLEDRPLCAWCLAQGRITVAVIADYAAPPYDGREFRFGALQSLCGSCHDHKTTPNELGYVLDIGLDGYPVDPLHPFNRPR
jgi:5-methylcytosine-specific restriction protein A